METINDLNFKESVNEPDVLVQFSAAWCGPCKVLTRTLGEVSKTNPNLKICKVDIESAPKTAEEYQVRAVPTIVYFKNGIVSGRTVGAKPINKLQDFINEHRNE